jgi:hypothetical protein
MMRGLLGEDGTIKGYGPWAEIKCGTQAPTTVVNNLFPPVNYPGDPDNPEEIAAGRGVTGPRPASCSGSACVRLNTPCTQGCLISPDLVAQINQFHIDARVTGARVTEAMPPSRRHQSTCHTNGTCIDYSKVGGMTGAEVRRVADAARANGLRPRYEVETQAERDRLVREGALASDILVLPPRNGRRQITAPHFSIYGYGS